MGSDPDDNIRESGTHRCHRSDTSPTGTAVSWVFVTGSVFDCLQTGSVVDVYGEAEA
jgi:hypothetical protein